METDTVKPSAFRRLRMYFMSLLRQTIDSALPLRARMLAALKTLMLLGSAVFILLLAYAILLIPFTPSIADLRKARHEQPSVLMSADGKRLAVFNRINREWVPLNRVSPHVVSALVATEDHRFYQHFGIEPQRMVIGALRALIGDPEGGSTLTQQLARNMYPKEIGRQPLLNRKIMEVITALKIEHAYSKKEILETYLNTVPFLYNAFGIEMAARTYFDKPASKLNLLESATLVGMLKGTSYYNPVINPQRAIKRRNVVLSQMVKRNVITQASFDSLKTRPVVLDFERQQEALGPAPHFAQHLRKWLIEWADRNDYNIYQDGLVVHTTIDTRLQAMANRAVERQLDRLQAVADVEWATSSGRLLSTSAEAYVSRRQRSQPFAYFWSSRGDLLNAAIRESPAYARLVNAGTPADEALAELRGNAEFINQLKARKTRLEAGFMAIDPITAHVKAWVGSRDFATDQFDHVGAARRQPGSTFKPFVYGAALEQGMSPNRKFMDAPLEMRLPGGEVWRPADVTPPTGKPMTAREGLIYSKNTVTARVMLEAGPRETAALARKMGVAQSPLDPVPALALGTSPVSLFEMVTAYTTIAAGGEYRQPLMVTRITDKAGNVLASFESDSRRAASTETSEQLIDMLRGAVNQGTGQNIRTRFGIRADVAGKTGTTQDNADGWFILMHPRLVAGAWVGFNDARVAMRSNHWGQGAHNALPVVGDFYQQALGGRIISAATQFPRPSESVLERVWDFIRNLSGPDDDPAPPAGKADSGSPLDAVQRAIDRMREIERTYRGWQQNVTDILDRIRRWLDIFG
ncbi:penicillin-binding protein 1A [Noviherbaspirillum album]|uniref:penicillin-binding protein 1A n=1 Tax=Noviherbaspirillum album TaxID=3080276 RepID=UPI003F5820FA